MRHIAIIGGGFSGVLLAINLLRHDGPRATLIEKGARPGRGAAYSTTHPEHLLNVRASNMSAFPDDPDHFVRWLKGCSGYGQSHFAPRRLYGDYLEQLLDEARRRAPDRLTIVRGEAVDVDFGADGATVRLADGRTIAADAVALTVGNLPPATPAGLDLPALPAGAYVGDPWQGAVAEGLSDEDRVLVLGTGLTMVDVALSLASGGFGGRIVALSRRGLVPHVHAEGVVETRRTERPPSRPSALLRAMRLRASQIPWRAAVDELRPQTQMLWRSMSIDDRARFLRHLRPWWDIHRHRIAPSAAATLERLRAEGRLEIVAGRICGVAARGGGLDVAIRRRGSSGIEHLGVSRLINATGPQGALDEADDPLLAALRDKGMLRADPLGIGLDVDQDSRAVDRDGRSSDRLMILGPMTRGAFWEIMAVPDIRRQAWSVARRLSNAHWVEGEGL